MAIKASGGSELSKCEGTMEGLQRGTLMLPYLSASLMMIIEQYTPHSLLLKITSGILHRNEHIPSLSEGSYNFV